MTSGSKDKGIRKSERKKKDCGKDSVVSLMLKKPS